MNLTSYLSLILLKARNISSISDSKGFGQTREVSKLVKGMIPKGQCSASKAGKAKCGGKYDRKDMPDQSLPKPCFSPNVPYGMVLLVLDFFVLKLQRLMVGMVRSGCNSRRYMSVKIRCSVRQAPWLSASKSLFRIGHGIAIVFK